MSFLTYRHSKSHGQEEAVAARSAQLLGLQGIDGKQGQKGAAVARARSLPPSRPGPGSQAAGTPLAGHRAQGWAIHNPQEGWRAACGKPCLLFKANV